MRPLMKNVSASILVAIFLLVPAVVFASDYVIGEGDTLQIAVWGVDRLNFTAIVRPDGIITVPGLGEVKASGLKPKELQSELTQKLKVLVKNPIVTVTVSGITNGKVYIFGGGIKSGVYDLTRKTTLLQILCSMSGLQDADLRRAYLLRNGKKIKENFYKLFIKGDVTEDTEIESDDAIFIPYLQDKSIYVLGAVTTPKAVEYREGLTVMEAILDAGGFTKFASLDGTTVVRKDHGKKITIPVKLGKLLNKADLSQNIKLMPGDYIIVKESLF